MIKRDITKLKSIIYSKAFTLTPPSVLGSKTANDERLRRIKITSSAFTIVELLVVIVVIGILAAITIVSYTGISHKAEISSLQSDLSNAKKQLTQYYVDHGFYPTTIDATTKCPKDIGGNADNRYCLKSSNGNTYAYYTLGAAASPDGFGLKATNSTSSTNYTITNNSVPAPMSTLATTDSANWLAVGTQVWAKYNLNVGTRIAGNTAQANNSTTEKYCYADTESNCTTYGGLYQWDEAMQYITTEGAQGICPAGSHIPSDNDWKILEMKLGMTQAQADLSDTFRGTDQGTQLKSGNPPGLNIPLAGTRVTAGSFSGLSTGAYLWSSREAWGWNLYSFLTGVGRGGFANSYGLSVRCLGN